MKPKTGIDSIQSAPASDTIWPDLNPDLDKAFGKGMPSGLDITTWASKSVKLLLTVRDAANVRVRRDTVDVKIGASTFRWNGRGKQDSVLRSGLYKVQITLLDTSRVIHSRNIWVQGLPDLVVIRDRSGLADRTAQIVATDRSLSVVVWDAPVALAYMRAMPQGAVASVSVPVDSSVFMGDG
ncbi:MAG: hypothetical protein IPN71_21335 [Fibrobacteres bacterium]|nr:hypothetical protein [Fibrobacterota bacterium]